jgi:hypothetical protein
VSPLGDRSRRLFALDSKPRARSPSAPPAATGNAYLNLTPLTELCNQHGGRAHWADDCSSPELPFLALRCPTVEATRLRAALFQNPKVPGRLQKAPAAPVEVTRVSMRAAAQRPTPTSSDTPLSRAHPPRRLEPTWWLSQPRSSSGPPRERTWPWEGPGVPSTVRKPPGVLLPVDRHPIAARR